MNINDYLEKLRQKPRQEKERIAVIATAIAFLIFFGIWLISFSENGKQIVPDQSSSTINDQLGDLKNSIGQDKQSIQDMMQSIPQNVVPNPPPVGSQDGSNANSGQNQDSNANTGDQAVSNPSPSENNIPTQNAPEQKNDQDSQNQPQNSVPSGNNIPQLP